MKPIATIGSPDVDHLLAQFPEALIEDIGPYERRVGYKCWKVPGQARNWLQWNNGDTPLPIRFENSQGEVRTWKLFARFGGGPQPRGPWDKPEEYEREKDQWMLAGPDVWGCSYEGLREYLDSLQALEELLKESLKLSHRYSIQRYAGLGS
jgi:hypothetical protein